MVCTCLKKLIFQWKQEVLILTQKISSFQTNKKIKPAWETKRKDFLCLPKIIKFSTTTTTKKNHTFLKKLSWIYIKNSFYFPKSSQFLNIKKSSHQPEKIDLPCTYTKIINFWKDKNFHIQLKKPIKRKNVLYSPKRNPIFSNNIFSKLPKKTNFWSKKTSLYLPQTNKFFKESNLLEPPGKSNFQTKRKDFLYTPKGNPFSKEKQLFQIV